MNSSRPLANRLNLLIVHPSANKRVGGIVNAGLSYVEGLLSVGHKVEVWTASRAFAQEAERLGAAVTFDEAFRSFLALCARPSRLIGIVKSMARFDGIIHNNGRLWPLACLLKPSRHFVVFHNESIGVRGLFRNWLSISASQYTRLLREATRRKYRTISVSRILNGLSPDLWRPVLEKPKADKLRIGFLAEIRPKKGLDVLLRAAALLEKEGIDFQLVVGGDGDVESHRSLANELGISARIEWAGWIDDKVRFFSELDIFCLPSRIEPFGIVVTEAFARGVPVVATRTDGPIELLEDSGAGLLVDVDDPANLAEALLTLARDSERRRECGHIGRAYVERNFGPTEVGARLERAVGRVASVANS